MERELLLLGLLRQHEMYGYQINDLIDTHLGSGIELTKPTAYRLLSKMAEQGWINFHEEQVGKRPTRRIFSLTESGEIKFQEMLRKGLSHYEPYGSTNTVSLAFLDTIPPDEALPLLEERRSCVAGLIAAMRSDEMHHGEFQLTIDHYVRHLETDLEWILEVIDNLNSTAL